MAKQILEHLIRPNILTFHVFLFDLLILMLDMFDMTLEISQEVYWCCIKQYNHY